MPGSCSSAHRCSSTVCPACTWRYSLHVSRRILACKPRQLRAFTINCPATELIQFQRWRTSIHNAFCYRRRQCRWWRTVGVWGWWDGDRLRGIISLGSITASEFDVALHRHGDVRLRPILIENIRTEVYAATRSMLSIQHGNAAGRYQPVKIAIAPGIDAAPSVAAVGSRMFAPMPMIV